MTSTKKTWIIVGTILAILLIGAAIVWVIRKKKNNQPTSDNKKPIKKPLPTVQAKPAPVEVQRQNA